MLRRRFGILRVLALLGATSCSQLKLGYGWADWMMERQIAKYLDLSRDQRAFTREVVASYLRWHRVHLLPEYADLLRQLAALNEQDRLDAQNLDVLYSRGEILYRRTVAGFLPGMAQVLARQHGEQVSVLERRMQDRHSDLAAQLSKPEDELTAHRVKSFAGVLEDFLGEVTPAQEQILRQRLHAQRAEPWLHHRETRARALVLALREGAQPGAIEDVLRQWWLGEAPTLEYARYRQSLLTTVKHMLYEVLAQLTPRQRQHLTETLRDYAQDLADLAQDS